MKVANAPLSYGAFEMTVGTDFPVPDPARVLEAIAAAGYAGTELGPPGYLGVADLGGPGAGRRLRPDRLQRPGRAGSRNCTRRGPVRRGDGRAAGAVRRGRTGADRQPGPRRRGRFAAAERVALARVRRRRRACRRRGARARLRAVFHHHTSTYVEGVEEIDRFLEETDVPLLLDSGHLLVAGGDPLQALADWGDRIEAIHVKDVRLDVLAGVKAERADTLTAWRRGLFCALGQGDVDLVGVLRRGRGLRLRRLGRRRAGPRARLARPSSATRRRAGRQPRLAAGARRMVNVGVIGAGLMGSTHARLLATAVSGARSSRSRMRVHENASASPRRLGVGTIHADGARADRQPRRRRRRDRLAGRDPRGVHARLPGGRQAGAVREAAGGLRRRRAADRRGRGRRSAAGS